MIDPFVLCPYTTPMPYACQLVIDNFIHYHHHFLVDNSAHTPVEEYNRDSNERDIMDDGVVNLNEWFAGLDHHEQINLYEVYNHSARLKEYIYDVPEPISDAEIEAIELAFSKVKGIEE